MCSSGATLREVGMTQEPSRLVFGEESEMILAVTDQLSEALSGYRYRFMPEDEYMTLSVGSEAMRVYWTEMLFRMHLAAATSVLRSQRWVEGTLMAFEADNHLAFGASLRGLVESAADTNDALLRVPKTLAHDFRVVYEAVHGKATAGFVANPDLEDALIHFSHGRRLKKGSADPESHKAKTTREYLSRVDSADGAISDCYSELCEITHPASRSVQIFLRPYDPEEDLVLDPKWDRGYTLGLCVRHDDALKRILYLAFNAPIICLRLLNMFDVDAVKTPAADRVDTSRIPLWNTLVSILGRDEPEP